MKMLISMYSSFIFDRQRAPSYKNKHRKSQSKGKQNLNNQCREKFGMDIWYSRVVCSRSVYGLQENPQQVQACCKAAVIMKKLLYRYLYSGTVGFSLCLLKTFPSSLLILFLFSFVGGSSGTGFFCFVFFQLGFSFVFGFFPTTPPSLAI